MARAVGIDFRFTGDATKAVTAFRQVAAAAKASGGDIGAAGRQIEAALNKAEAAAKQQQVALRTAVGGGAQSKGANFLQGIVDSLGLGEFTDQFGGVEEILAGVGTKAAVAATGVGLLTAATVKLGVSSAKSYLAIVGQVDAVADVTGATAKEASELVGVFNGLGISTDAGASAMAKLAKAVGTNEAGLLKYGIVVARNADGTANLSRTLLNVASAYQATKDPADKAALASAVFGKSWAEMVDVLDKARPKLDQLMELAPSIDERDIANMEAFKLATADLRKSGDDIKVTFGRPLVQVFSNEIGKATGQVKALGELLQGNFSAAFDEASGSADRARGSFGLVADDLGSRLVAAALQAGLSVRRTADEVVLASQRAAQASAGFARIFDTQTTAVNAQVRYQDALAGLRSFQTQATSNANKYAQAQDAVASASGSAARAAADGARRIADAERDAADDVVRAQERVTDAREKAFRSAQNAADRVADAERALRDAATVGAGDDNPLEQQRRIEEARIELDRARRDQAQDAVDSNKDVSRSERDLVDTQEEGARRVADARREAAEAQADALQRVTDAQSRATEAIDVGSVSVGTMTGKVDDLVTSTFNAAYQTALMGGSQEDVKKKVDEAKRALEEYGPQLGLTAAQVEYYRKQLELIPLMVPTRVRVDFSVGSAVDVARRGLAAAIASTIQPPQFAGGGTFRVPGGGAGLAILHDGEKVLTPDQQQQGVSITVNGYVGSEQQLVELISKAYRQGFR